ncbi:ArsR family transcriptional regulator, partial [Lentzea sp. PSKA42]|nr:ArsR family transcriptional regulator [Lentzea indica]
MRAVVDADRAVRARSFLDGGCEGVLSALHPTISWAPPVLSIESRFPQRDVHLHGQGLVLVPSYFCWERPIMLRDQRHAPVLVYPIARDLHVTSAGKRSLEALIGRTRAAALEV